MSNDSEATAIPWLGARKFARGLLVDIESLRTQLADSRQTIETLGILSAADLEKRRIALGQEIAAQTVRLEAERAEAEQRLKERERQVSEQIERRLKELDRQVAEEQARLESEKSKAASALHGVQEQLDAVRRKLVATEEITLLQEAGVYKYRHPLSDAVAYEKALESVQERIKEMTRKDGRAVLATSTWTVNGSDKEGRAMVRDFSKLMLRAFNAEADNLVRGLKPYKVDAAIERLTKVADTIARLGKTMQIRISPPYLQLRVEELNLTADFLHKQAEQKELERLERERLKEERKAQQEMEQERLRLEKERQHYENALAALEAKGDENGAERLRAQLADVKHAIEDVDYRAANIRAGYVYVISNVGSFGERMVKVGLTRRLDPRERIRELSDASVPFNFDIHAVFFSKDAVGIEAKMHERLADVRVNMVNRRREFFNATPLEAKAYLSELAGELLEFQDVPEALEYRQSLTYSKQTPTQ